MGLEYKVRRHPTRQQLVAYAECLVDGRTVIPAPIAGHVQRCPICMREVRYMRASLEFTASAPDLEPSNDLTAQILMGAKQERHARRPRRLAVLWMGVKGLTFTAAMAGVTIVVFGAVLGDPGAGAAPRPAVTIEAKAQEPTPEDLGKTASQVRKLAAAVRHPASASANPREWERRRALNAMDADITAALDALERNPGCVRASHIVHANVERQARTLRDLYADRSL